MIVSDRFLIALVGSFYRLMKNQSRIFEKILVILSASNGGT